MENQIDHINGVTEVFFKNYDDSRGSFREWYKESKFNQASFNIAQANVSISHKGSLRGLHYSLSTTGQDKLVSCLAGSFLVVVVDIRLGSPTFGKHVCIKLSAELGNSIKIQSGLAHSVLSLEDNSILTYLLSSEYSPSEEFSINPFDSELDISWPETSLILSEKDKASESLSTMRDLEQLPIFSTP